MAMASVWTEVCRSSRFQSVLPFNGTKVPSAFFWYGRPSTNTARDLTLFIAPLHPQVGFSRRTRSRHCERSEAIQGPESKTGLLRRCAPRNDEAQAIRAMA